MRLKSFLLLMTTLLCFVLVFMAATPGLRSHIAALRSSNNFDMEVCAGIYKGARCWFLLGRNQDIDMGVSEDIWGGDGLFPYLEVGQALNIVSTDAEDNPSGTGVGSLLLRGCDANWDFVQEVIELDGLTPVVTANDYLRINQASGITVGSSGFNQGILTATSDSSADIQFIIAAEEGIARRALFSPCNGEEAYIESSGAALSATSAATVTSQVFFRIEGGPWLLPFQTPIKGGTQDFAVFGGGLRVRIPARSDLRVNALSDSNNSDVYGFITLMTLGSE